MFETIGSGIFGAFFGGLFRLAPEVLKWLDRKNEREHERSMFAMQTDLEKTRGTFKMEEKYAEYSTEQLKAISEAFKEQANTATQSYKWVAALSAITRPGITWLLFALYCVVKTAGLSLALSTNADWQAVVLKAWTAEDFAMLNMILTFWFVGRSIERYGK